MRLGQFYSPSPGGFAYGSHRVISVANPAAGKDWEVAVQGGFYWRPVAAIYTLKTKAQAGERRPGLLVKNGQGTVLVRATAREKISTEKTIVCSFFRGAAENVAGEVSPVSLAMPDVPLEPGFVVGSSVAAIQTEDQLEAITLWVEQFDVFTEEWQDQFARMYDVLIEIREAMTGAASIN